MAKQTYDSAYKELNAILDDLSSQEISIDEIAKKSKRANELLLFCKEKLRTIEEEVASAYEEE